MSSYSTTYRLKYNLVNGMKVEIFDNGGNIVIKPVRDKGGDIVLINFNPQSGKEIKENCYAVILSYHLFNANTGFVSLCPITNTKQVFGYEINISDKTIVIEKRRARLIVRCYINTSIEKFGCTISTIKNNWKVARKYNWRLSEPCLYILHLIQHE